MEILKTLIGKMGFCAGAHVCLYISFASCWLEMLANQVSIYDIQGVLQWFGTLSSMNFFISLGAFMISFICCACLLCEDKTHIKKMVFYAYSIILCSIFFLPFHCFLSMLLGFCIGYLFIWIYIWYMIWICGVKNYINNEVRI